MSISAVAAPSAQPLATAPVQPKSNDHDADDGVVAATPPAATTPPPAPGTGTVIDKTA